MPQVWLRTLITTCFEIDREHVIGLMFDFASTLSCTLIISLKGFPQKGCILFFCLKIQNLSKLLYFGVETGNGVKNVLLH